MRTVKLTENEARVLRVAIRIASVTFTELLSMSKDPGYLMEEIIVLGSAARKLGADVE